MPGPPEGGRHACLRVGASRRQAFGATVGRGGSAWRPSYVVGLAAAGPLCGTRPYGVLAETQAIDRAHRIGQTRQVFAYRLIARDTVEERVPELQQKKRKLADAILNADGGLIRDLRREDLELLLS
jgi:hypothetical protein